jgi:hypothetical protein
MSQHRQILRSESRMVLGLFGVLLVACCAAAIRGATDAGAQVALALLIAAIVAGVLRLASLRVVADERGLAVRNFFGSRLIAWSEVDRIELGPAQWLVPPDRRRSKPFVGNATKRKGVVGTVVLRDGRIYQMSAITGSLLHDPAPQVQALTEQLSASRATVPVASEAVAGQPPREAA